MGLRCRIAAFVAGLVLTVVQAAAAQRDGDAPPPTPKPSEKLVYADFEVAKAERPSAPAAEPSA